MNIITVKPIFNVTYFLGDSGFSAANDWIGKGIQYGGRFEDAPGYPPVNHAFTVVGENEIVEAQISNGVVRTELTTRTLDPNQKVYIRHPLLWTPAIGQAIAMQALKTIGSKYDDLLIAENALADTLAGHAFNEVFRNLPHHILDKLIQEATPGEFICSFNAAFCLAATGIYKGCAILNQPSAVDPQLLFVCGPYESGILDVSFQAIPQTNPGGPDARVEPASPGNEPGNASHESGAAATASGIFQSGPNNPSNTASR